MSNIGLVYHNDTFAGTLEKIPEGYQFTYDDRYMANRTTHSISMTMPKSKGPVFRSKKLFPFFLGLLAEGHNKDAQCLSFRIDERDAFTRLLKTAGYTTIGAITVREG